MRSLQVLLAGLALAASHVAIAIDARERGFVREWMPEGEVLFRIGKPDHEAFVRNVKGRPEEKTWTYSPHPRDPQTLTILTLRPGVVAAVERKVVRQACEREQAARGVGRRGSVGELRLFSGRSERRSHSSICAGG